MTKELVKDMINLSALNSILDTEFDKAFRSEIFSKKREINSTEISKAIFQKNKESYISNLKGSHVQNQRLSLKNGIVTIDCEDWKSAVPESTLLWLQGKMSSASTCSKNSETTENSVVVTLERK